MVKVPTYERTETLRPAYRQDIDVRATPEALGGNIGAAMQQGGRALGEAAKAVDAIQGLKAENDARAASTSLATAISQLGYGENGFYNKTGNDANDGALQSYRQRIEELAREHGAKLNPRAAQLYQKAAQARIASELQDGIKWSGQQTKAYTLATLDASASQFANDAALRYTDRQAMAKNLLAGEAAIRQKGDLKGLPSELIENEVSAYRTTALAGIAERIADSEGALAADAFITEHKDAFTDAAALQGIRKKLAEPLKYARTVASVDAIEKGLPPPDWTGSGGGVSQSAYDVVLGYGAYGAPPKPLSTMTLGEVISYGKNVLIPNSRAKGVGRDERGLMGSSAVGAYQITQSTLQDYAPRVLGPNWQSMPFTADAQDKIAEAIFNDRKALGSGLSKTWAGLSPSEAERVSQMPWAQAKVFIAAAEGTSGKKGGAKPIGNTPEAWLASMYREADKIKDPTERKAAYQEIDERFNRMKRVVDADTATTTKSIEDRMLADPNFDPSSLPLAVQQQIGPARMNSYKEAYRRNQEGTDIKSDPKALDQLQTEQAMNPDQFANKDLSPYLKSLSPKDFQELRKKQLDAKADAARARRNGSFYQDVYKAAGEFYGAAGIKDGNSKAAQSEDNQSRRAAFNAAVRGEVEEFVEREKRQPTYDEMRAIAAALSVKTVASEARGAYSPMRLIDDGQDDVWEGYAYQRGQAPAGTTLRYVPSFANVPAERVEDIRALLRKNGVANPTNTQIAEEWGKQARAIRGF